MKKFYLLLLGSFCFLCGSYAQTLIDPVIGGGFDLGNTFAANGWTVVNGTGNQWVVGSTTFNSSPNSAYISSDGNVANYNYDNTTSHISHFYQLVTIPANATNIILSFQLKGNYENDAEDNLLDGLEVYTDESLTPPVANTLPGGIANQVYVQSDQSSSYSPQTVALTPYFFGRSTNTQVLIIFTWINDGNNMGSGPPASVDDVKLTYCINNTNYPVSGGGGFCPGSPGAHIGLPGSVEGITYQLYNNGLAVGSPVPGTGSAIDFGPQPAGGPYTVKGKSGACTYTMSGNVSAFLFPSPTATASSNSPICAGSTLNLTSAGGTTYNWTGPNSFTSQSQDGTIPNVTPAAAGTYKVVIADNNGCKDSTTTSVTINPVNTATLTSSAGTDAQTVCFNTPITTIKYATTGATGATFNGLPNGVIGSWASNVITISGTPTVSGSFPYTITLTGGCPVTISGTINVTTNSTISLTSTAGTDAQTKCINAGITDIAYSITGATGATVSGLPAGVTGNWASNVFTISGTPSEDGIFNYTVSLTGGCGAVTASGTITVILNNSITLTSASGTDAQTKCINTSITDITYATTGATGATFSGLPPGVTGGWAANVITITGTPTSTTGSPFNYTLTLTGGCGNITASGTLTVNPQNTITLTSANGTDAQTKCVNTSVTDITYATSGATGATVTGLPTGVSGSWASNQVTISGTPSVAGTFPYTITLTGGCGNVTATGSITVTPDNTITLSSAPGTNIQTKCINTAITDITYTTSGATGATFSGLPPGVTGGWAANVVTISGTPTSATGSPFNYTVTLTGGCGNITASGTLTVTPANTITLTSAAGTDAQTKCFNTAITPITYTTTGASGATFSGLPTGVSGSFGSNTVTISGTSFIMGISTYTITLTGGCGTTTTSGTITVTPDNTITLSSASGTDVQTKCINTAITDITYSTTGATGATFSGLPPGVSGGWASNVVTISGTPTTSAGSPFNYTVNLTGNCGNISAIGTITVTPLASISLTSAAGTDAQTICSGGAISTITYAYNNVSGASVTGLPAGLNVMPGIGTITISGIPTQTGAFTYHITTTGGCGQATTTGIINVQPALGGSVSSVSICSGGSNSVTISGQSGSIIGWESTTDTISGSWSPITNTSPSQSFNGITVPTFYRVVTSNACGNIYSSIGTAAIHNYWTGAINTDWNTAGNWSDNQVPSMVPCPDVYIPNISNQPVISGTEVATIGSLYIYSGASLTVNGSGLLQVAGSISNQGILDVTNGSLEFNGSDQSISGSILKSKTVKNLIVSSGGTGLAVSNTIGDTLNIVGTLSFGNANADLNTGNNITLKSTAAATANVGMLATGNVITGNVTVERFIPTGTVHAKSWQLLAIPTVGQTINQSWQEGSLVANDNLHPGYGTQVTGTVSGVGFDAISASPSMKTYNYATNGYTGVPGTGISIYNPEGYFVFVRGDRSATTVSSPAVPTTLRTRGKLFTPANPPSGTFVTPNAFQSVGNPYASAIDMTKIGIDGDVSAVFTVWDPSLGGAYGYGAFQTLTLLSDGHFYAVPGGGSYYAGFPTPTDYIQSGQAFFAQTSTNGTMGGNVTFDESAKVGGSVLVTTPNPVLAAPPVMFSTSLFQVVANGSTHIVDGVLSLYGDTYSNAIDRMDARKIGNTGENLAIKTAGKLLSVERRQPITVQDTLFLNLTGVSVQNYRFHFNAINLNPGIGAFLVDNYLNTRTPVSTTGTTDVDFSVVNIAGSYAANRFMIVFAPQKVLPVTFTSIKAYLADKYINVEWRVDNEFNMKEYDVEKSTDGLNFTQIAVQAPTANNGSSAVYVITDEHPVAGYNYYRVKSVDVNGAIAYSTIVKVLVGNLGQDIAIYPNPITDGTIHLQLVNLPAGRYGIRLLNKLGQVILQKQINCAAGTSTELIQWDYNLAHGMYQLEVTKPDGSVKNINVLY